MVLVLWLACAGVAHADPVLGVVADGPLFDPAIDAPAELDTMHDIGLRSLRFSLYWNQVQPYRTLGDVPASERGNFADEGGVPTNLTGMDIFVAATAQRRIAVLPVVLKAPAWARRNPPFPFSSPNAAGRDAYVAFLRVLVKRYGAHGAFWAAHPDLPYRPIETWQVWNEPNGPAFWYEQPGVGDYVTLLKAAYPAIKAADPDAQVILGGLFAKAWIPLARIYALGGGPFFDAAAIHPFTKFVSNVMLIARRSRKVMNAHGDADKPLMVTELGWPSAKGVTTQPYGYEVTPRGQARKLRQGVLALVRAKAALGLSAIYWTSWSSYDRDRTSPFDYSGLRHFDGHTVTPKPAYAVFKRLVARFGK
jgi:hypothetical protein